MELPLKRSSSASKKRKQIEYIVYYSLHWASFTVCVSCDLGQNSLLWTLCRTTVEASKT